MSQFVRHNRPLCRPGESNWQYKIRVLSGHRARQLFSHEVDHERVEVEIFWQQAKRLGTRERSA